MKSMDWKDGALVNRITGKYEVSELKGWGISEWDYR
jgi:hypothetical protein